MASGIKLVNHFNVEIYNTETVTWNYVGSFVASAASSSSQSFSILNELPEYIIQRHQYNDIPLDKKANLHTVSVSGTTVTASPASADSSATLIVVLAR